jgi:hypothetical protein
MGYFREMAGAATSALIASDPVQKKYREDANGRQ